MDAMVKALWMVLLVISFPVLVHAQEGLLKDLYSEVFELYDKGRYSEAADIAEAALDIAKKAFGPEHPNVGISLNNLGYLFDVQGKPTTSQFLYKQALAILENSLGPDHFRVGIVLRNMADCYRKMGRLHEAKRLEARAAKINTRR
jgi:tetratricopeptide (TPR) repeat protein